MSKYVKRTQVLLTEEQYERLTREARVRGESMGSLIRDALDEAYPDDRERKRKALEEILKMELPVKDWETMEKEIEDRWLGSEDEEEYEK